MSKAEAEERILDMPHRASTGAITAWALGFREATGVVYAQSFRDCLDVFDCDAFEGVALPEIPSRVRADPYNIGTWLSPHDLGRHEFGSGQTPREVALKLGVSFRVVPCTDVQSGIDAVRRLFGRLRFDRRCAKLLEALGDYQKVWDATGRMFRDKPLHSWHSHYADALRVLATGYREGREAGEIRRPKTISRYDLLNHGRERPHGACQ